MAATKFKLDHGIKTDKTTHFEVELRELTAGDILEAEEEAEKLVNAGSVHEPNYVLVRSNIKAGVALMRRQIKSIGDIQGPMSAADIKGLHAADLDIIQAHIKAMDTAAAQALIARGKS